MDITSSFKTQIGGDDDDGKKQKKKLIFVGVLILVLSITAWFFIQPLISGETPAAAPAAVAKNPNKPADATAAAANPAAAVDAAAAAKAAEEATRGLSKADAAAAAAAAAASATPPAPNATAPSVSATADATTAVTPAADALVPPAPPVATGPVATGPVAAPAVAVAPIVAAPVAPVAVPRSTAAETTTAARATTAPPAPPTVEASPPIVVDGTAADPAKDAANDAPVDRWEKLRTENPGTVLPSNDMWVFQTRKLKSKVYVVKHAESLKAISAKLLYSDRFWVKIWSLNPTVLDADNVPVGTEIVIDPNARGTASH